MCAQGLRRLLASHQQQKARKNRHRRLQHRMMLDPLEERQMMSGTQVKLTDMAFDEVAATATITVALTEPASQTVSVQFHTADANAVAGLDYVATSGTLLFQPGQTAQSVSVALLADSLHEADEVFNLFISNPSGATIFNDGRGIYTVRDNDAAPQMSINDVTITEGHSGTASAVFTVSLSAVSGQAAIASYETIDGTAQTSQDFDKAVGSLMFPIGTTQQTVTVAIKGELRDEDNETLIVRLSNPTHSTIVDSDGVATIIDDDWQLLATGADAGGGPHVCVLDPLTGEEQYGFFAYNSAFAGGVRVATADVNRDGVADVITSPGAGGGPHVRVFDGKSGSQLGGAIGSFWAYNPLFTGGVFVAGGDLNDDGYADIVTGAGPGGGSHVRVFSGLDGSVLNEFMAFAPAFSGGVRVAVEDIDHDGKLDIIASAGPGGGPQVRVFHRDGTQIAGPLGSFFAYAQAFTGGVYVSTGDVNGDGYQDIITGAGAGGGPHVRVFDGASGAQMGGAMGSFFAFDPGFTGGVRVAAGNVDGDHLADVVVAAGPGGGPHVRAFRGSDRMELASFMPYNSSFTGGLFVAAHGQIDPPPSGIVDPLEVLDANDGLLLFEGVTEHEIAGFTVDLRAQVYGGTVATYSWDVSGAAAINVTGDTTERLQFTWDPDASGEQTIVITTVNTDTTEQQRTLTFFVEPSLSQSQFTTAASFPTVVQPDNARADQETIAGSHHALALNSGELFVGHDLPSYNPGIPGAMLTYSSIAADPRPIFIDHFRLDPAQAAPAQVSAKLTLNGVAGTEVYYNTSLLNGGNIMQIALQGDATSLATGRYSYSIDITSHYATPVTVTHSGSVNIINRDGSEFGDGWSLAGLQRLHFVTGGAILELDRGLSLWFANNGSGGFTTPDGDFSTLVQNMDGTYTRTMKDGVKINFNSSGLETSVVDRRGNTMMYGYNASGKLTSMTDPNTLTTSFGYNAGGRVATITDPAMRVTSLTYDGGGRLDTITDPDTAVWTYGYDTSDRLAHLTDPRNYTTTFVYNFAGRVGQVNRPDGKTELLTALQMRGLVQPPAGTSMNPANPVLAVEADADYTDGRGNLWQTRLDWLGMGHVVQHIDPSSKIAVMHRDADGLAYLMSDEIFRRTRYLRDAVGNVLERIDPDDLKEVYTYNAFSQLTQRTERIENIWRYTYDAVGNLTEVIQPDDDDLTIGDYANNPKYVYTHDASGNVLTEKDPLNFITSHTYDARDRLTQTTHPDDDTDPNNNFKIILGYDAASNLTTRTNERGFATSYSYDAMGRLETETRPDDDTNPANNPVYSNDYDAAGNLTLGTDPLLHTMSYTYDALGRQLTQTNGENETTTLVYDGNGNVTTSTDPLLRVTTFTYDAQNRQTAITRNPTVYFGYDDAGQMNSRIDELGNPSMMDYTPMGWLNCSTDSRGFCTQYAYDANGRPISKITIQPGCPHGICYTSYDAMGRPTSDCGYFQVPNIYQYNARGDLVSSTGKDPDGGGTGEGGETINEYDAQGRRTQETTPAGYMRFNRYTPTGHLLGTSGSPEIVYSYDAQDRLTSVTDQELGVSSYTYDLAGRLTSVTDPVNNTTSYTYDNADRLVTRTDPRGKTTQYVYDDAGQLTSMTDRNGRETEYTYDNLARRTAEKWLDATNTVIRTITYNYDNADRLTSVTDPDSTYTYTYDTTGNVTSVNNTGTPLVPQLTLNYILDEYGQRTSMYDNRTVDITYMYDYSNRLTSLEFRQLVGSDFITYLVGFGYDNADRLTSIGRGLITTSLTYDTSDRLTNIVHSISAGPLSTFSYGYNTESELTSYTGPEGSVTYTYDETHQLTGASGARTESYSYDANGNRDSTVYQTGTNNRLLADGTYTYEYDDEGNRTKRTHVASGAVREYAWDHRNRLTKVVNRASAAGPITSQSDFTYDVNNNLIIRATDPDGAGSQAVDKLFTVYDGIQAYADFDNAGQLTERYIYNPQSVDQILARVAADGDVDWYLADNLGSVRQVVDTDGTILNAKTYDSFGNIIAETNPSNGDRFAFTAREWEAAVDLYFYRARWMDPAAGEFISDDPIEFGGDDTNLYRYVGNRPTQLTDPLGLIFVPLPEDWHSWSDERKQDYYEMAEAAKWDLAGLGTPWGGVGGRGLGKLFGWLSSKCCVAKASINFAEKFGGKTAGEIVKEIGPQQVDLLRRLFKGEAVEGITRETLERYHEIARRAIEQCIDKSGEQARRIKVIEDALKKTN